MRMPMPMPRKTTKTEAKTTPSFVATVVFVGLVSLSLSLSLPLSWAPAPAAAQTVQAASTETGATAPPGPTPRLPNGKPDLSGTWQKPYVPDVTKDRPNHQAIADLPFTPWGLENWTNYDPIESDYTGNCMPYGLSRSINGPFPMRIMQDETHIALLFELGAWFHVIPLDGRDHPEELDPTWFGHSVGRWEGDTLVVDTVGFNGYTRIDTVGHPHSDALHMIQTFDLVDAGHIKYTVTVDDPKTYTTPWTTERIFTPFEGDLMEYVCQENNRALWEGRIKPWTPPWRDPPQ